MVTVGKLKEMLEDFGDHLELVIDIDDVLWGVNDLSLVSVEDKKAVRIDW